MQSGVGKNLAGIVVDLAGGKDGGTYYCEGDDDGLQESLCRRSIRRRRGWRPFRFCGEELLVHGLVAEHEKAGGQEDSIARMRPRCLSCTTAPYEPENALVAKRVKLAEESNVARSILQPGEGPAAQKQR